MNAGFIVHNNKNDFVIDSNFKNLQLLRMKRVKDIPNWDRINIESPPLSDYNYNKRYNYYGYNWLFIHTRKNELFVTTTTLDGTYSNSLVCPHGFVLSHRSDVDPNIIQMRVPNDRIDDTIILFWGMLDEPDNQSGYGMQVFLDNGDLVYDSNSRPLKVLKAGTETGQFNTTGKKISIYSCGIELKAQYPCAGYGWGEVAHFYAYENGKIVYKEITVMDMTGKYASEMKCHPYYILIDVSNYI